MNSYKFLISQRIKDGFFFFLLALIFLFFVSGETLDPDLPGHLMFGKEILEGGRLILIDRFSFVAEGKTVLEHEWLSEVLFYLVFKTFGSPGLVILKYGAGLLTLFLIFGAFSKGLKKNFLLLIFFAIVSGTLHYGWTVRPQLFTYLFFALFLFLLLKYKESKLSRFLYPIPILMIFWVNLHGGFLAGIGLLFIFLISSLLERSTRRGMIFVFLAACLATFINPYGTRLHLFLFQSLSVPRPQIAEWNPADFSVTFWYFYLLGIMAVFAAWRTKGSEGIFTKSFLLLLFLLGIAVNRHTVFFGIAAGMILPPLLKDSFSILGSLEAKISGGARNFLLVSIALIFSAMFFFPLHNRHPLKILILSEKYPLGAIQYMKEKNLKGNLLVYFDWAQHAIWELSERGVKVFVDGRFRTLYSEEILNDYFDSVWLKTDPNLFFKKYPLLSMILLPPEFPLSGFVKTSKEWVLVYASKTAFLFLKEEELSKFPALEKKFEGEAKEEISYF